MDTETAFIAYEQVCQSAYDLICEVDKKSTALSATWSRFLHQTLYRLEAWGDERGYDPSPTGHASFRSSPLCHQRVRTLQTLLGQCMLALHDGEQHVDRYGVWLLAVVCVA